MSVRKSILKTFAFLFTLTLGVLISFNWYFSYSCLNEQLTHISIHPVLEIKASEVKGDSAKPWILKISPCEDGNPITFPSSDWKGNRIISGGVVNRWVSCGNLPDYPQIARNKRIINVVTVDVIINEIGEVMKAEAKTGDPIFFESAVNAAYKTRFSPRLLGGTVYKVKGILMYKFDADFGTWLQDPSAPDNPFKKFEN